MTYEFVIYAIKQTALITIHIQKNTCDGLDEYAIIFAIIKHPHIPIKLSDVVILFY